MLKKGLAVIVILFLLGMCVVPSTAVTEFKYVSTVGFDGNTLYVGGSGTGNYTSIQSAIDNASDDDTVFVYDDSSPYYENIKIINSINLIGEDRDTTIIDGDNNSCIILKGYQITVMGFYLKGDIWGIDSDSDNNLISNNNIYSRLGIGIYGMYNYVFNNTLDDGEVGIVIATKGSNYIINNEIKSHTDGGIVLETTQDNIIDGNTIMNYGHADGLIGDIQFYFSDDNIISNNTLIAIDDGTYEGIWHELVDGTNIYENNTFDGYKGSGMRGGRYGVVRYNDFINCDIGLMWFDGGEFYHNNFINCEEGLSLIQCRGANIKYNNFIDNDRHASFSRRSFFNTWDSNYWGEPRDAPYIIRGSLFFFFIPWFNFDWNPAQEPYDIGG